MSASNPGEIVRPRHCQVSATRDRKQVALTFRGEDHAPITVVLPVLGAAGLQHRLAQSLFLLGVRPAPRHTEAPVEPPAAAS